MEALADLVSNEAVATSVAHAPVAIRALIRSLLMD